MIIRRCSCRKEGVFEASIATKDVGGMKDHGMMLYNVYETLEIDWSKLRTL